MKLPEMKYAFASPAPQDTAGSNARPPLRVVMQPPGGEPAGDWAVPEVIVLTPAPTDDIDFDFDSWEQSLSPLPSRNRRSILPHPRSTPRDPVARAPLAHIPIILREMQKGDYDLRTVMAHCQGMDPASSEFRKAYFEARLTAFDFERGHAQRHRLLSRMNIAPPPPRSAAAPRKFIVNTVPDLVRYFGPGVLVAAGLEAWLSWKIGHLLDPYVVGGVEFLIAIAAFIFVSANSIIWLHLRGRHVNSFTLPGTVLIIVLAAMALSIHLQSTLAALLSDKLPLK